MALRREQANRRLTQTGSLMPDGRRLTVWLAVALGGHLLAALAVALGLDLAGRREFKAALFATAPGNTWQWVGKEGGQDSWVPMLGAYGLRTGEPPRPLYHIFFVLRVKFQYPPSALLPFDLLPRSLTELQDGKVVPPLQWWLDRISVATLLLTVMGSALILEVRLAQLNPGTRVRWGRAAVRALLVAGLGLTYYPLIRGYALGQIQVPLACVMTIGILAHLLGRDALSGACFGLCCLVKPQYGVLLAWGLLRRRWRFALGAGALLALGLGLSLARFGLADHLDYVRVLRAISSSGEAYWPNQSANGLANRLLGNGDPVAFSESDFAPYHPLVHAITLCSSLALLGLALVPWPPRTPPAPGPADMLLALAAATMASPVAWEHHYAAFLPVFAAALPDFLRRRPAGRLTLPLLTLSYLAVAGAVLDPDLIFANRWRGLLGSHVFLGALVLFALLLRLRVGGPAATPGPAPGRQSG